jgi:hypothetical protein
MGYAIFTILFRLDASFVMAPRAPSPSSSGTERASDFKAKRGNLHAWWFWSLNHPNCPSPLGWHTPLLMSARVRPPPNLWRLRPAWLDHIRILFTLPCTIWIGHDSVRTSGIYESEPTRIHPLPSLVSLVHSRNTTITSHSTPAHRKVKIHQICTTLSITHHLRVTVIGPQLSAPISDHVNHIGFSCGLQNQES